MSFSWVGLLPPFVAAIAVAGLLRLAGGPGRGAALAGVAVPAGFLAGWLLLRGLPALPPRGALDQVPAVALLGLVLGAVAVLRGWRRGALLAVTAGLALAAAWAALGFPAGWSWPLAAKGVAVLAAWMIVLPRLESRAPAEPVALPMLVMLACGIGAVALAAGQPGWARPAFALAAAAAGFGVWNWGMGVPCLAPAILGGAGAAVALGAAAGLSGALPWPALAVLLLVPFADGAAPLAGGSGLLRRIARPLALMLVCLLPLVLAVAVALVMPHLRTG